jgi:uroporphyrinogen III methyltransferase/synthase
LTDVLEELGAEAIESPAIKILPVEDAAPLRQSLADIAAGKYDWIVFTSVNGVEAVFDQMFCRPMIDGFGATPKRRVLGGAMQENTPNQTAVGGGTNQNTIGKASANESKLDARIFAGAKIATIGPATAEALLSCGICADAQPQQFTSLALVQAIADAAGADQGSNSKSNSKSLAGKKILCLRSDIAPKNIIDDLLARGAAVTDVVAYRTVADTANVAELAEQIGRGEIHWITFTSSSTVENFVKNLAACAPGESIIALLGKVRLASIGPSTSETLRKLSLFPAVEAKTFTIPGLVQAILEFESGIANASPGGQE